MYAPCLRSPDRTTGASPTRSLFPRMRVSEASTGWRARPLSHVAEGPFCRSRHRANGPRPTRQRQMRRFVRKRVRPGRRRSSRRNRRGLTRVSLWRRRPGWERSGQRRSCRPDGRAPAASVYRREVGTVRCANLLRKERKPGFPLLTAPPGRAPPPFRREDRLFLHFLKFAPASYCRSASGGRNMRICCSLRCG